MKYFEYLRLQREPFSISPDPDFFYESEQHEQCLDQLEAAITLRRGLNIVVGDVGTGKTLVCRMLMQRLSHTTGVNVHLVSDPYFESGKDFLQTLASLFGVSERRLSSTPRVLKEAIRDILEMKAVEQHKINVLIIDEGQKISREHIEILREILNFETESEKLLQMVIFAQNEFEDVLALYENLADRANLIYRLKPLGVGDTKRLILKRLRVAGKKSTESAIFTSSAVWAVYWSTGGYPRKIIRLCHQVLLAMIARNKTRATWRLVRSVAAPRSSRGKQLIWGGIVVSLAVAAVMYGPQTKQFVQHMMARWFPDPVAVATGGETETMSLSAQGPSKTEDIPGETATIASDQSSARSLHQSEINGSEAVQNNLQASLDATGPPPPGLLGRVRIEPGWVVEKMARQIYGRSDHQILDIVAQANPDIYDLGLVGAGQTIVFPAIVASPPPYGSVLLVIGQVESLPDAFAVLAQKPDDWPNLRLFVYYHPTEGLVIDIVVYKVFFSPVEAARAVTELPVELSERVVVVDSFLPQSTFYSELGSS
ncbi:ExeA family protein [Desulfovibrio inopinatus]|uniref:ExeA family protein n=1 Tax=Desulfovibrio inopinatus TaxID=102109 RepID=UPI000416853E|nr:AAA family ATPase [Desulfovibrio inopinatus]